MNVLQRRPVAWTLFGLALVLNLVFMYAPRVPGPPGGMRLDLLGHAATFAALTFTGLLARVPARWLLGGVAANAVVSEVVQQLWLPDRTGDPTDLAADAVGIALGYLTWRVLTRRAERRRPPTEAGGHAPRADGG